MANLLVKGIEGGLLREVNYAAKGLGLTQAQWVIKVLEEATNGDMQAAGGGVRHAAPVQERSVSKVRSRSKGHAPSPRKPEEQATGTEEIPAVKSGKKLTAEQFLGLSNSEQMRAKREERF